MKILQLPDELHEYLLHVVQTYSGSGIHPKEGLALFQLWDHVSKNVTTVDESKLQRPVAAPEPVNAV